MLDVGGTSIKTGAVRFENRDDDPRIEIGPVLPTNSNELADVVLDSLAAAADAALEVAGRSVSGLAIAICGPFDIDAGISRMQGVHKFEDIYGLDLRAALRERSRRFSNRSLMLLPSFPPSLGRPRRCPPSQPERSP